MTIYDIVYQFIADYIFGGIRDGSNLVGYNFQLGLDPNYDANYIDLQSWLCHTATIIIMVLIIIFAVWLVRWIFKAVSSAFLLRR